MNTQKVKRNWEILSDEERTKAINELIDFFSTERQEQIGVIAAGEILDRVQQSAGILIYNRGVDAAKDFMQKCVEEANVDLEVTVKK